LKQEEGDGLIDEEEREQEREEEEEEEVARRREKCRAVFHLPSNTKRRSAGKTFF